MVPSLLIVIDPVYGIQFVPSKLYSVEATPERSSVAVNVTVTSDTYQPLSPEVPVGVMVVVGGVVSAGIMIVPESSAAMARFVVEVATARKSYVPGGVSEGSDISTGKVMLPPAGINTFISVQLNHVSLA